MSHLHTLIALNRAYCSGEITRDEVLADLKANAPALFIEVPDRPPTKRVDAPKPVPKAKPEEELARSLDTFVPTAKEQAAQTTQKIINDTEWMSAQTKKSVPYDDFGNIRPLDSY